MIHLNETFPRRRRQERGSTEERVFQGGARCFKRTGVPNSFGRYLF